MSRFHEQYYNIQVTTATRSIKFQLVLFWMTSCCETLYWGSSAHWCTRGRVLLVSCVTSMLSQMFNGFNSVRCVALMGVVVCHCQETLFKAHSFTMGCIMTDCNTQYSCYCQPPMKQVKRNGTWKHLSVKTQCWGIELNWKWSLFDIINIVAKNFKL